MSFVRSFMDVSVTESSTNLSLTFPSDQLDKVLKIMCSEETDSVDKLKKAPQQVRIKPSNFHEDMYGVIVSKKINPDKIFQGLGNLEVEDRNFVRVVWFRSKLELMKAIILTMKNPRKVFSINF